MPWHTNIHVYVQANSDFLLLFMSIHPPFVCSYHGLLALPHQAFWTGMPSLIKDGILFSLRKLGFARGEYQEYHAIDSSSTWKLKERGIEHRVYALVAVSLILWFIPVHTHYIIFYCIVLLRQRYLPRMMLCRARSLLPYAVRPSPSVFE